MHTGSRDGCDRFECDAAGSFQDAVVPELLGELLQLWNAAVVEE